MKSFMCASQLTFKVERKNTKKCYKMHNWIAFWFPRISCLFSCHILCVQLLSAGWNWLASNFILWNRDRQLEEWLLLRMNVLERRVMLTMLRWLIWIFDCVTIWRKLLRDAHKWRPHIHWNRIGCWLNTKNLDPAHLI